MPKYKEPWRHPKKKQFAIYPTEIELNKYRILAAKENVRICEMITRLANEGLDMRYRIAEQINSLKEIEARKIARTKLNKQ